ncbi:glycosyltransferase family 1 protein [Pigmentiphaga sp.]|uniref:glycosyltransferase family 4 protein n=1 Tax=Pigmentiphaga sp. TaxID=1977564 RepID=UPI0025F81F58|nr:glycosyltransferase family 1 protein [Pigmentiphaga sp.]
MQGAQTSFSRHRGVGRYTVNLAKALVTNCRGHEILLAMNGYFVDATRDLREGFSGLLPERALRVWQQRYEFCGAEPSTYGRKQMAEIIRQEFINSLRPDVLLCPNLQEGFFEPAVTSLAGLDSTITRCTTLHDVTPLMEAQRYLADHVNRAWYSEKIEDVRQSEFVLTVSASSKNQIAQWAKIGADKIHVIPNGVDTDRFSCRPVSPQRGDALREKYSGGHKFGMYIGGNDYHKNLDRLYQAYARTKQRLGEGQVPKLMLVGKEICAEQDTVRLALKKYGILGDVFIPGFVSDDDLVDLLNLCEFFVFPALNEGFGLPVLEAMACGAPVIASTAPSLVEIVDLDDALFDPTDVNAIAAMLEKLTMDADFRQRLRDHGLKRAATYSWDTSGARLMDILEASVRVKPLGENQQVDWAARTLDRIRSHHMSGALRAQDKNGLLQAVAMSISDSFPSRKGQSPMLYLDVSAIRINKDHTGIQRVVRGIASEVLRTFPSSVVQLVYATPEDLNFRRAGDFEQKWVGRNVPDSDEVVEIEWGDTLLFLDLHPRLAIAHERRSKALVARGIKVFHVVHDLLPARHPEFFWEDLCSEFNQWLFALRSSSGIACVSRATMEDYKSWAADHGPLPKDFQMGFFHLGADIGQSIPTGGFPPDAQEVLENLRARQTFLMVGTLEPRKGHEQVLSAFEFLWNQGADLNLVFVGKMGWSMEEFAGRLHKHPQRGSRFFWLQGISDEYLEQVYEASTCLIAASYGEGFGLPLIEAAQRGLPIIARDISVFHEVAGEHAYYFRAQTGPELACSLQEWIRLQFSGKVPESGGMETLTWADSAHHLLQLIFPAGLAGEGCLNSAANVR